MKEIEQVRRSLQDIPRALMNEIPSRPPRRTGPITKSSHAGFSGFEERDDIGPVEARADLRDAENLFQELDEAVSTHGLDVLAWYHPFHLSARDWGIYVPLTSVHYGADRWFNNRISLKRRASLALKVLLDHELIHYACEYAVAQFELFLRAPCWAPARERLRSARLEWFNDEEALANANSIRQLAEAEPRTIVDRVHRALLQSPPGYRDFPVAISDEGFADHIAEVLRHNVGIAAIDLHTGFLDPAFDLLVGFPALDDAEASCSLYFIDDTQRIALPPLSPRLIASIPTLVETKKFQNMLRRLDLRRQEEWQQMKLALAQAVPPYPKFKKLKGQLKGLWGLYLSDGFRVHIRPATKGVWEAVEIGSHTAMGHG